MKRGVALSGFASALCLLVPHTSDGQARLTIHQALAKFVELRAQSEPKKGEFETTAQFEARRSQFRLERHNQIVALLENDYSGNMPIAIGEYDADRGVFPVRVTMPQFNQSICRQCGIFAPVRPPRFEQTLFLGVPRADAPFAKTNARTGSASGRFWIEPDGAVYLIGKLEVRIGNKVFLTDPGKPKLGIVDSLLLQSGIVDASVVFSPDGKFLVTGGGWNAIAIKVWNTSSWSEVRTLAKTGESSQGRLGITGVLGLDFSPDGRWLAAIVRTRVGGVAGHDEDSLKIWDTSNYQEVHELPVDGRWRYYSMAFSPDGTGLALGVGKGDYFGISGQLRILDVAAGNETRRFNIAKGEGVHDVAFSPDGKWIATGEYGPQLRLWDPSTGREITRIPISSRNTPGYLVAFSPDSKWLASGDSAGVKLWDPNTQEVRTITGYTPSQSLSFSADGRWLASSDGRTRITDVSSGEELRDFRTGGAVTFSPDGRWVTTVDHTEIHLLRLKERR